ncbi:MAG: hypothetical protein ACW987_20975 [Candidatus Thorarchaeota archaeon]
MDGNLGRSQFTTGVITASIAALKVAMDIKKNALMRPSELAMFRLNDCGFPINVAGVEQVTLYIVSPNGAREKQIVNMDESGNVGYNIPKDAMSGTWKFQLCLEGHQWKSYTSVSSWDLILEPIARYIQQQSSM